MVVVEQDFIDLLRKSKRTLLIEPPYDRSYPPMSLGRVASFLKSHGRFSEFSRSYIPAKWDLICLSSSFSYYYSHVKNMLHQISVFGTGVPIVIGGSITTTLYSKLKADFPDVLLFKGCSKILDSYMMDYSIDYKVEKKWKDFAFVYTSRSCANNCPYCVVKRIEPEYYEIENWKEQFPKGYNRVVIMDNNILSTRESHFESVIRYLVDNKKSVSWGSGIDIKFVNPEKAHMLSMVKYNSHDFKTAFDRIEENGIFQKAIRCLIDNGVPPSYMSAYVLFNFNDTPREATFRAAVPGKIGIKSYPMRYNPLTSIERNVFIGKHWTKNLADEFQKFHFLQGLYRHMDFREYIYDPKSQVKLSSYDFEVFEKDSTKYE